MMQVGASNELPESEELDALYDRFLIRRQVSQVSDAGLAAMLAAAADNNLAV
jgi:MoxR-like ATPase